jgi:ubiquinone/menaquinone biosynthesis C-methylase UbiE
MNTLAVPNHHADFPAFSGLSGYVAGLSMLAGRRDVARLAADTLGLGPADRLVDIGSGPGVPAREAARRGATVAAIDPARVMLDLGRRLTGRRAPIRWLEGTAEALPIDDAWATACWSIATVHHWRDVDAGLAEVRRVLAPAGRLLAIERRTRPGATGHASHGWTDAQAEAFAERCRARGFADVTIDRAETRTRGLALVLATAP